MRAKLGHFFHLIFWLPALLTGVAAIFYARLIDWAHTIFLHFSFQHPQLYLWLTPLIFLIATALVRLVAPSAAGSGIPQVLHSIHSESEQEESHSENFSVRTMIVKVLSSTVGIFGGASIGREGPTVQIASSIFALTVKYGRKRGWKMNYRPFLIAGASAGVAAAFNTPIAGITFAIEEVAENFFFQFKRELMLAVIIAGITAQAILGDYLYFGHPVLAKPSLILAPEALLIGVVCGAAGALFAVFLSASWINKILPRNWVIRALICGMVCGFVGYGSLFQSGGSGYETVRRFMEGDGQMQLIFGPEKFVTTVFSYLSGMAGGIFSPCLSIGAGLGYALGELLAFANLKVCVLIGMVSFFSGVVQAPLTSVVIVMEMTDEHMLVIPFLIASYLAQSISHLVMPVPLYRKLAEDIYQMEKEGLNVG